jgi:translation initiation factor 4E
LKGDNWNDLLKEVVTFSSVEEFWGIYVGVFPRLFLGLAADGVVCRITSLLHPNSG